MNKRILTVLLIVLFIIVCLNTFKIDILKVIYPQKYKSIINTYANEYKVEECLIFAVIKAESNFNENAVSHKNAIGLMQIMENTAKEVVDLYDINIDNNTEEEILKVENNINIGTKYLSILLEKYNNVGLAVAAYNAGTGTIDKWLDNGIIKEDGSDIEKIPYKETNNYVRKILANYKVYNELYYN